MNKNIKFVDKNKISIILRKEAREYFLTENGFSNAIGWKQRAQKILLFDRKQNKSDLKYLKIRKMSFSFAAASYIVALICDAFLIFFSIFHTIAFDELKTDYK